MTKNQALVRTISLCGFIFVVSLMSVSAQAGAVRLGFHAGLHGGTVTRYTAATPEEPIKGGTIGINYGAQGGVDAFVGPLWLGAIYSQSNMWAKDYASTASEVPENRYENTQLILPLMFNFRKNSVDAGVGAFYAHPLSDAAHQDSGIALAARVPLKQKLNAGITALGGFRKTAEQGNMIQMAFSLGYNLN